MSTFEIPNRIRCVGFCLFALIAASCSRPGGNSPSIRKSSAAAPCPKKQTVSRLSESELSLAAPKSLSSTEKPGSFNGGGYISIQFFGVETNLEVFKSPSENLFGKKVEFGNPKGVVDVLNIPYCTLPSSGIDVSRLEKCVSRSTWDALKDQLSLQKQVTSAPWNPRVFYKECTALVTIDPDDKANSSSHQRLRLWTAEHCFQPSYAKEVVFKVSYPRDGKAKTAASDYVSMNLNKIDSLEDVKKIVAKGGGAGKENDPLLKEKLFILRSLDGRSAETYKRSLIDGCLGKGSKVTGSGLSAKLKYVDCFTTADMATFKATVEKNRFAEIENDKLMPSERSMSADELRTRRNEALARIVKLDAEANGILSALKISPPLALERMVPIVGRTVSFGEMLTSQMDGIQYARRYEAMNFEKRSEKFLVLKLPPEDDKKRELEEKDLGILLEDFKRIKFNFSSVNFIQDAVLDVTRHLAVKSGVVCPVGSLIPFLDSITGAVCPIYQMSPPDTAQLEEMQMGKSINVQSYLSKRLQVWLLGLGNSSLPKVPRSSSDPTLTDHPLKILPSDNDSLANMKMGAIWTRVMFEAATLRKNPFSESVVYGGLSSFFQQALQATCPSAEFAGQLFPVFANLVTKNGLAFGKASLLGGGASLKILPVVRPGDPVPEFVAARCGSGTSIVRDLGAGQMIGSYFVPNEAVVGLDVDDSALSLPAERAAFEYMAGRVAYRYEGASGDSPSLVAPSDSGMGWTFLGYPSFALSSHNGNLTNGVVFTEMPDINTPDPDAGVAVDSQGRPIINCSSQ